MLQDSKDDENQGILLHLLINNYRMLSQDCQLDTEALANILEKAIVDSNKYEIKNPIKEISEQIQFLKRLGPTPIPDVETAPVNTKQVLNPASFP